MILGLHVCCLLVWVVHANTHEQGAVAVMHAMQEVPARGILLLDSDGRFSLRDWHCHVLFAVHRFAPTSCKDKTYPAGTLQRRTCPQSLEHLALKCQNLPCYAMLQLCKSR